MSSSLPTKTECFYLLEMLRAELINHSYTSPWAEQYIHGKGIPPTWLCDLVIEERQGDQIDTLGSYVFGEPFEPAPSDLDKFHVACLWLRHERRDISFASFLRKTSDYLHDAAGDWHSDDITPYLKSLEDAGFLKSNEATIKQAFLDHHTSLKQFIKLAKEQFKPILELRRRTAS